MSDPRTSPAASTWKRGSLVLIVVGVAVWLTLFLSNTTTRTAEWSDIRTGLSSEVAATERSLNEADVLMPQVEQAIGDELDFASLRAAQLTLMRGLAGTSAWPWRCLAIQEAALKAQAVQLREHVGRLENALKDNVHFLDMGIATLNRLAAQFSDQMDTTQTQVNLDRLRGMKARAEALDARLAVLLAPLDAALVKLGQLSDQSYDISQDLFLRHYAFPSHGVFSKSGHIELRVVTPGALQPALSLHKTFRTFFSPGLFILMVLAATLVIGHLARLGSGLFGHGAALEAHPGRLWMSRWLLSGAAAVTLSLAFDPFASTPLVLGLRTLLMAAGLCLLSLGLAEPGHPIRSLRREPLMVLLGLFALSVLIGLPGFPGILVSAAWTVCATATSLQLWFLQRARQREAERAEAESLEQAALLAEKRLQEDSPRELQDESAAASASGDFEGAGDAPKPPTGHTPSRFPSALCLIMALLAAFSAAGFGPHALFASQMLFLFYLSGRLAALLRFHWHTNHKGEPSAMGSSLYPVALAALSAMTIGWGLDILGGMELAQSILNIRLNLFGASISVKALIGCGLAFLILRLVLAWVRALFAPAGPLGKLLDYGQAHTLRVALSYTLYLGFVLVGLSILGIELSSLTWIASGLSVGIGFGLKDIVNNFVSGLIILFGGVVRRGDILQQGKTLGEVVDISMRNTTIRTLDNTMVIIPNSRFLSGEIVNLSYADAKMKVTIPITVAPGTKIKKMEKLLLSAAKASPHVLPSPPAQAEFARFNRQGLEFELSFWVDHFLKKYEAESAINKRVDKLLQEAKILVAFQGVKFKYKPKGKEAEDLEAKREELREKRREMFKVTRALFRKAFARRRGR